jgi:hypothetical protein
MKKLEDIINEWKLDVEIDLSNPHTEILKIGKLHSKYIGILSSSRLGLKKVKNEFLKERRIRYEYYSGRLSEEELEQYNLQPFRFLLKQDIDIYLDSDELLIKILDKKIYYEEIVSLCESIIKELGARTFQLNGYLKHIEFLGGK